jgi:hypothetical protein
MGGAYKPPSPSQRGQYRYIKRFSSINLVPVCTGRRESWVHQFASLASDYFVFRALEYEVFGIASGVLMLRGG